jgi:hypothetical protein
MGMILECDEIDHSMKLSQRDSEEAHPSIDVTGMKSGRIEEIKKLINSPHWKTKSVTQLQWILVRVMTLSRESFVPNLIMLF